MSKLKAVFSKLIGSRKNVRLSLLVLVAAIAGLGLYLNLDKLNRQASENPIGPITNQATLTYTDSQGQQKTVTSNTVMTTIVAPPSEATFNFSKSGWYLFALSQKPANSRAESVFHFDCENRAPYPGEISIDGSVFHWQNSNGSLIVWDAWSECGEDNGAFASGGHLDTGQGYWVNATGNTGTITYATVPETAPKIVNIGKTGWALVGNPFTSPVDVDGANNKVLFTKEGSADRTWAQASLDPNGDNWVEPVGYWWDAQLQALVDIGPVDAWTSTQTLGVNNGVWIQPRVDGVSIKFIP
jgi:hypothetical protein